MSSRFLVNLVVLLLGAVLVVIDFAFSARTVDGVGLVVGGLAVLAALYSFALAGQGVMSEVLDRKIQAARVGPQTSAGEGTGQGSPMSKMFAWYDKRGLLVNALILRAILGREPRTLKAYLEELAASPAAPMTRASR